MQLTEHRRYATGLPDLLLYASLIDDGVLLLQDGALMAGWGFAGPDLASATPDEMAVLSARLSAVLRFGSGWMVQCDAIRTKAPDYSAKGAFQDAATFTIDQERRAQFTREGSHFESEYFLTLTYQPPMVAEERVRGFMFEGGGEARPIGERALQIFKARVQAFEEVFAAQFKVRRLKGRRVSGGGFWGLQDELLQYIRRCVIGEDFPFVLPEIPAFLHDLVGCREFVGGIEPEVGGRKLRVVAIEGFPHASYPGILAALDALPMEYRWNTRAILLDPIEAHNAIEKQMKRWRGKSRGFFDQLFGRTGGSVNHFAVEMAQDAEGAMSEASRGDVQFAQYTSCLVMLESDAEVASENAKTVAKTLENLGFAARIETLNAIEAWRGTLPGDGYRNVRRTMLHTLNLADCLPISSVWCGAHFNPSPLMPKNSPPLMYATSLGATPFRLHLHDSDVGHTLVLGPSGAGKSTLLCTVVAQWFRYPNAQVMCFDKGYSMQVLTAAAGGEFYDLGGPGSSLNFCPLGCLETAQDLSWAADWVECLCGLVGLVVAPEHRNAIAQALKLLRSSPERTLSEFCMTVQDESIRAALEHYTLQGALGNLLEASAEDDGLGKARFSTYEMQHLMDYGDKGVVPVLLYLFRQIEKRLDGSPTLIVLDEAWTYLQNELFRERIVAWLRTFRKANAAVVLATQSLSDVMNSPIRDVVVESCRTKILLPNAEAGSDNSRLLYKQLGLNSREIEIIQIARPKEHYYVTSSVGRRLISLGLGPVALAFTGVSDPASRARALAMREADPVGWVETWLRTRGLPLWADAYRRRLDETTRKEVA